MRIVFYEFINRIIHASVKIQNATNNATNVNQECLRQRLVLSHIERK